MLVPATLSSIEHPHSPITPAHIAAQRTDWIAHTAEHIRHISIMIDIKDLIINICKTGISNLVTEFRKINSRNIVTNLCKVAYVLLVIFLGYRYIPTMGSLMVTWLLPLWNAIFYMLAYVFAIVIVLLAAKSIYEFLVLYLSVIGLTVIAVEGSEEYQDLLKLRQLRACQAEAESRRQKAEANAWCGYRSR